MKLLIFVTILSHFVRLLCSFKHCISLYMIFIHETESIPKPDFKPSQSFYGFSFFSFLFSYFFPVLRRIFRLELVIFS